HFRQCGLSNFAFYGNDQPWGHERGIAFDKVVKEHGYQCLHMRQNPLSTPSLQSLIAWLHELPTPVGILARDDSSGRRLIDASRLAGLSVPEEIAVLGIDNDTLMCELAYPSLSSIDLSVQQFGFEAARTLDDLMKGNAPTKQTETAAPRVIARLSTNTSAIADPLVARAVRYIREHLSQGVRVPDILSHVTVSRKTLYSRFKKSLGRSPHEEILRAQIEKAQSLLREPNTKILTVAKASGFNGPEYMHYVFKKHLGITPHEYRRKYRDGL
ncbi:MAG: substrate-binding domain-containing protein, partial [Phycisphaerales bacterium]|nr:substrate-binding domain-containing protein [Phycisphaerales bacterium]